MSDEPAPRDYSAGSSPFRRRRRRPLLERSIPISRDLPGYRPRSLRTDLVAGLTVAALAIPAGMAYAEVAWLSPVIGLYALLLPTVAYALLGSSRLYFCRPRLTDYTTLTVEIRSRPARSCRRTPHVAKM